jgi:hypothetical protein
MAVLQMGICNRDRIDNNPAIYWLQQHIAVHEIELSGLLHHYILSPDQLLPLGYPVESPIHLGCTVIYNECAFFTHFQNHHYYYCLSPHAKDSQPPNTLEHFQRSNTSSVLDPNAREFVPRSANQPITTYSNCSDEDPKNESQRLNGVSVEKTCGCCRSSFFVTPDREYLAHEKCVHH